MRFMFRLLWYAGLFFVFYLIYTIIKIKFFADSIDYSISITGIDSSRISNLLKIGTNKSWVEVGYKIKLKNISDFSIEIKNLVIEFYNKDFYIGETEKVESFKINKNGESELKGKAKVHFNKSALNLFLDMQNQKPSDIQYKVRFTLFFIPITYWDKYTIGETEDTEAVVIDNKNLVSEKI